MEIQGEDIFIVIIIIIIFKSSLLRKALETKKKEITRSRLLK